MLLRQRGEHLYGKLQAENKNNPDGQRLVVSNLDPQREYQVICLQSHLQPPPRHEIGIKSWLEEMKATWNVVPYTVLDAAKEFAKSQKVLQAPAL